MLAAIRATELGVTVFRSAYSGTSFVAEPHGNIHAQTELFIDVARVVPVRLHTAPTLYAQWGDWFPWLCLLLSLGLATVSPWRKSQ
jgi:apolipoprotein N-acyltransferase